MKSLALLATIVCFALAALYLTGHGPAASAHKIHVAHAVLFAGLGLLSLLWYRFAQTASDPTA